MSETTDGLTGEQLAKLLSAAWDGRTGGDVPIADAALIDALAETLDAGVPPLPAGATLGDVLRGDLGGLEPLQQAKRFGRELATSASELDRAVGTAVYYAAIAAALARHNRRITRHETDALAVSLADLEKRPWTAALHEIYARGRESCGTYIADDHEED